MFKLKYDTIRSLTENKEEEMNFYEFFSRDKDIRKRALKYNKDGLVFLVNPSFSGEEIIGGIFRTWIPDSNPADYIFERVYDIMFPHSVEMTGIPEMDDLRFFHFGHYSGEGNIHSSVLHTDPFMAYLRIKGKEEQFLNRTEKAEAGHIDSIYEGSSCNQIPKKYLL
jgi:hypothetical protein